MAIFAMIPKAWALDTIILNVNGLTGKPWKIQGVQLALSNIEQGLPELILRLDRVFLPKPFQHVQLINIRCRKFSWQTSQLSCQQGRVRLKLAQRISDEFTVSFQIKRHKKLEMQLAGKDIPVQLLQQVLAQPMTLTQGKFDLNIKASGNQDALEIVDLDIQVHNLTGQSQNGLLASEKLNLNLNFSALNKQGKWYWQTKLNTRQGALYIDPVYLDVQDKNLKFYAKGNFDDEQAYLTQLDFVHADIVRLRLNGNVQLLPKQVVTKLSGKLETKHLEQTTAVYLMPFLEATSFEGFSLAGQMSADFVANKKRLTEVNVQLNNLSISDQQKRLKLSGAQGDLVWADDEAFKQTSHLGWQELVVKGLPFDQGDLDFFIKQKQLEVQHSTIPLLGGELLIKHFYFQVRQQDDPDVEFEGEIQQLSLQRLTDALGWEPMVGDISGEIPGVVFKDKKLTVAGEIKINLFDGEVRINNLASSGLFTDFAQFYSDIEIDKLDLDLLTRKFSFGSIEGRLSGFIRGLYMENWQPVGFHAWLGSSEDDDGNHRISQKAVENIASIGGGGAADVISKGFLRFFDSFDYEQLGLGCYLHNGVCQLMGVSAVEQGYYIVKGGGLPRIDVIGYNPRVDWPVLISRLSRVMGSNEMVVE